ncbi:MAG: NUDIX domain-containing protein, partial [Chloroflexi bacterium]
MVGIVRGGRGPGHPPPGRLACGRGRPALAAGPQPGSVAVAPHDLSALGGAARPGLDLVRRGRPAGPRGLWPRCGWHGAALFDLGRSGRRDRGTGLGPADRGQDRRWQPGLPVRLPHGRPGGHRPGRPGAVDRAGRRGDRHAGGALVAPARRQRLDARARRAGHGGDGAGVVRRRGAVRFCDECGAELPAPLPSAQAGKGVACTVCGQVWYPFLKVAAGVLVEQGGALLLLQRSPADDAFAAAWNLPAGFCRAGEEPRQTAAREAAEEAGLEVRPGRLAGAYFFDDDPRGEGLLLVYEADVAGGRVQVDGLEAVAAGFFPPEALPAPLSGGGHDQAIRAWAAKRLDRWQPGLPLRYCPHCTHPLEERLAFGRRRPACRACGFVHFREAKVGVSVLVEETGRLLLVRRAIDPGRGLWSLPSGFLDWDEAPEVAAVRECAEETGLRV